MLVLRAFAGSPITMEGCVAAATMPALAGCYMVLMLRHWLLAGPCACPVPAGHVSCMDIIACILVGIQCLLLLLLTQQVLPGSGEPAEIRMKLQKALPLAPPPEQQVVQEHAMLHTTVARLLAPALHPAAGHTTGDGASHPPQV